MCIVSIIRTRTDRTHSTTQYWILLKLKSLIVVVKVVVMSENAEKYFIFLILIFIFILVCVKLFKRVFFVFRIYIFSFFVKYNAAYFRKSFFYFLNRK